MGYIKVMDGEYILGLAQSDGNGNITEAEYTAITDAINGRPIAEDGYAYRLKTDLTWELVELPPAPAEPTVYTQTSLEAMTNAELEQILYGYGITASMNKANMIRLILQAQGGESFE